MRSPDPIVLNRQPQEVMTLEEAKSFCRITHELDDVLLADLIEGCVKRVERILDKTLVETTYRVVYDAFPGLDAFGRMRLELPRPPVSEIVAFKIITDGGVEKNMIAGFDYFVGLQGNYPYVRPVSRCWPRVADRPEAIVIDVKCAPPEHLEKDIKIAIGSLVAFYYTNREVADLQQGASGYAEAPGVVAIERILWSYKRPKL